MKRFLRRFVIELFGLYAVTHIASGLVFQDQLNSFLITAAGLTVATYFIKPIVNILILPLTLATLGLLKFIGHAVTLYVVDVALDEFQVTSFNFPGFNSNYFDLPAIAFQNKILSYLAFALLLSFITSTLHWLCKK
jgi:uncharacterized membrane protein YvlD (DUF360 family)